jgi:hypothetical protein
MIHAPAILAAEAAATAARREAQYPPLVAVGKIAPADAARDIRVWHAIARDWRYAAGQPISGSARATPAEKRDACADAVRRFDRALAKAIAATPPAVARDCADGADLDQLRDRHGDAAAPILAIHDQREPVIGLRDFYARADPDRSLDLLHIRSTQLARAAGQGCKA